MRSFWPMTVRRRWVALTRVYIRPMSRPSLVLLSASLLIACSSTCHPTDRHRHRRLHRFRRLPPIRRRLHRHRQRRRRARHHAGRRHRAHLPHPGLPRQGHRAPGHHDLRREDGAAAAGRARQRQRGGHHHVRRRLGLQPGGLGPRHQHPHRVGRHDRRVPDGVILEPPQDPDHLWPGRRARGRPREGRHRLSAQYRPRRHARRRPGRAGRDRRR